MKWGRWIALGVGVVALGAGVAAWWYLDEPATRPPRLLESRRLDPIAFKQTLAANVRRARELAARRPSEGTERRWPMQGQGAFSRAGRDMIEPQCMLGARELCAALGDLPHGCDAGDADDCIAVAQFVADTPPHPWIVAATFFIQACRIGDATGCERFEQIKSMEPRPCKDDLLACGRRAAFTQDRQLNEEACSLGVADSCVHLAWQAGKDVARTRAYVERACQLGWAGACEGLARQLRPDCVPSETQECWPPDPVAAKAAREMACAAGFGDETLCNQP